MSAAPALYGPSGKLISGKRKQPTRPAQDAPDRAFGKPHGTYVLDLAEKCDAILLCHACKHRFSHEDHHYYKDERFREFTGKCDACREFTVHGRLFIHEKFLTDTGGRSWADRSWNPK